MSTRKIVQGFNDVAQIDLGVAHIATLPTGERVELPAGTVLREGTLPPEAEDDRPTLGEQIHDEHDRARRDLTERVGLPREMAPSVVFLDGFNEGMRAARAEAAGGMAAATIAEALRLVAVAGGTPPELAGLTLAAYNAARSGLKRGTSAKAGVAALMSAYTAGVERAIADHAKART